MTYRYSALGGDTIRILVLLPGDAVDSLLGELELVSLRTSGPYEALSYVWGSEEKSCTLQTPQGTVYLTQSLHEALLDLRLPDGKRRLWADAICINQDDNREKSDQVAMMGTIYSSATLVLVHLCRECDQTNTAFELLEGMRSPLWRESDERGTTFRADFARKDLAPVAAIMNLPWWQRVWVIQEFVNAKDVYMMAGSKRLHWQAFFQAVDRTYSYSELSLAKYRQRYPRSSSGVIAFATLDIGRDRTTTSLLELLDLFQNASATRQRDHLFALLPLATDATDPRFRPDYAVPLDSIVRRYAAAFVEHGHVFHLLGTACPELHGMNQLRFPSWIPDWTAKRMFRDPDGVSTSTSFYQAGGSTKPQAQYDLQTDILFIQGHLIDSIQTIIRGPSLRTGSDTQHGNNTLASYVQDCLQALRAADPSANLTDLHNVLRRTLIIDRDRYGEKLDQEGMLEMKTAYEDLTKTFIPFSHISTTTTTTTEQTDDMNILKGATDDVFSFAAEALCDYLVFAVTDQGLPCLIPSSSQVGDWMAVLHGCPVPFVLRPIQSGTGSKCFQLVRKAYLHGLMDGEAITNHDFPASTISLK